MPSGAEPWDYTMVPEITTECCWVSSISTCDMLVEFNPMVFDGVGYGISSIPNLRRVSKYQSTMLLKR